MNCEHWKNCGDCHSPALVSQLRALENTQRERAEKAEARVVELGAAIHDTIVALAMRRGPDKHLESIRVTLTQVLHPEPGKRADTALMRVVAADSVSDTKGESK